MRPRSHRHKQSRWSPQFRPIVWKSEEGDSAAENPSQNQGESISALMMRKNICSRVPLHFHHHHSHLSDVDRSKSFERDITASELYSFEPAFSIFLANLFYGCKTLGTVMNQRLNMTGHIFEPDNMRNC